MPLYLIKVRERGQLLSDNGHTDEFADLEAAGSHAASGSPELFSAWLRNVRNHILRRSMIGAASMNCAKSDQLHYCD